MSFTPFNAPLLSGLLGDAETASFFSVKSDLEAVVQFELALAETQADLGLIEREDAEAISRGIMGFEPFLKDLGDRTAQDGVAVPALLEQLRDRIREPHSAVLHKGSTSQDAIDSSLMIRLSQLVPVFVQRLNDIIATLEHTTLDQGTREIMSRTRMQRALPVTMRDKIAMWVEPLWTLRTMVPMAFPLQLGGPEGALSEMGDEPHLVTEKLAAKLGLTKPTRNWQTDRQPIIDIATWATKLTTALGKVGQDIALMAQQEIGEVTLKQGGASSSMPHKSNPVLAESLVTLARFNATLIGGLHQAALHENERSGAAWTLEWMLLPQMMVATGASLRNSATLLDQVSFNTSSAASAFLR